MGQNLSESVTSFVISIDNGDYVSAFESLDRVFSEGGVEQFSKMLERIVEWDGSLSQLKIRDCIAEYLGFGSLYFALLQPSYEILRMVSHASSRVEAQDLLLNIVRDLVEKDDPQVDLSFIEIDSLKESQYVILIPYVLSKRANELATCTIPYSVSHSETQKKLRYCLTELLQTHYGRKIVNAFKFDSDYPIIGKSDFEKLHEILQSFGLDVNSMLVELMEKEWPYSIIEKMKDLEKEYKVSDELWLLYRTYMAMIRLGSDDERIKRESLQKIEDVGTKFCNDALITMVTNDKAVLKVMALRLMEKSRDYSMIDPLCNLIPEAKGTVKKSLFKTISSIESAQYFIPGAIPVPQPITQVQSKPPTTEMTDNYLAALNKLSRSSSTDARIDAVRALTAIRIPGVDAQLRRLMNDEDPMVRLAVLDASFDLPKEEAVGIIRLGLQDVDNSVENRALQLMEERWPDSYW